MSKSKIGDIFAQKNEEINKWTLIQVIHESAINQLIILNLDGFYDTIPKPKEIVAPKPFVLNHHNWDKKIDFIYVGNNSIPDFVKYVTNISSIMEADLSSSIGQEWLNGTYDKKWYETAYNHDWPMDFLQIPLEYKWNLLDESLRVRYKKAVNSDEKMKIGKEEVSITSSSIRVNARDLPNIEVLNSLVALSEIEFKGPSNELIKFINDSPLIEKLIWDNHEQTTLDFSDSVITELRLDLSKLKHLKLNDHTRFLCIFGDLSGLSDLKVQTPSNGQNLEYYLYLENGEIPNLGLKQLNKLSLWVKRVDMHDVFQSHPNIKSLSITGDPGYIDNIHSLSHFKNLETIKFRDTFGIEVEDFPSPSELPNLVSLNVSSISKDVGEHIKKNFKHLSHLHVDELRNEKWITDNINNPFRDWEDYEEITKANFKKAFNAFKRLHSSFEKDLTEHELKEKFIEFIQVFNKIDEKSNCIGTIEREDIYEIYMDLADKSKIDSDVLFDIFEKNRDF